MTPLVQHVRAAGVEKDTATSWVSWLQGTCKAYQINTPMRIAMFLAQIAHESAGLTRLVENLNYSAEGLMRTWPTRFPTLDVAQQYAREPEKIANRVYANRMGNGDEASGDGWKYRGRGLIQITGKSNYKEFADAIGEDYVADPDLLRQPVNAALSAGWFWAERSINRVADTGSVEAVTKIINGGTHGLADRQRRFADCLASFKRL